MFELEIMYDEDARTFDHDPFETTEEDWTPVARLLSGLLSLRSFTYAFRKPMASCIWTTLSSTLPSCKIRLDNFQFTGVGSSDRGNLDLAFAANVVSLKAFYMTIRYNPWPGHDSKPDYTLEAALDMVDGLLPNFTSLDLHTRICFHSEPSPAWMTAGG